MNASLRIDDLIIRWKGGDAAARDSLVTLLHPELRTIASAQLRRELGTLVHEAVREHGLPSVSVSDVEVTRDMAHAKVFVTALMPERSVEAVKGLKELAWGLRMELARRVKMRHVPELHFHYDDSVDRGERIENLLRDLPPPPADDEA